MLTCMPEPITVTAGLRALESRRTLKAGIHDSRSMPAQQSQTRQAGSCCITGSLAELTAVLLMIIFECHFGS